MPPVGAVHVSGTQRAPLQVADLVEDEERMVTRALKVPVVGRALLLAVGWAHAAVDVEDQHLARAARPVDPASRQLGQGREVLLRRHRLGLEAAHLACGSSLIHHCSAAHDPAHRRITPEAVGIVHVLVAGQTAEHGLAELGHETVPTVHPGARVDQRIGGQRGQAERVVEFPECEQTGVGRDARAVELQPQAAVEIEAETHLLAFTRRIPHPPPPPTSENPCPHTRNEGRSQLGT